MALEAQATTIDDIADAIFSRKELVTSETLANVVEQFVNDMSSYGAMILDQYGNKAIISIDNRGFIWVNILPGGYIEEKPQYTSNDQLADHLLTQLSQLGFQLYGREEFYIGAA